MSSTLSRPAVAEVVVPAPIQVQHARTEAEGDEAEFAGFVRAIALGVVIGVPVVGLLIAAILKFTASGMGPASVFAIAAWVAIWTGVFLGGTVTVGLWSAKQHRGDV
jgi:predicted MFS family arabinose efflux permease